MPARLLLIAASLALFGFAPAPFPRAERQRADPTDVTGTWVFTASEVNGAAQVPPTYLDYRVEMTKTQIVFSSAKGPRTALVLTLDPNAAPPSFTWGVGNEVRYVGSYRLQRDELTMIFQISSRPDQRPTDFAKPPWKYVLRRVKRN
jgi:uncharacterized protein (TIGR03067 family)